MLRALFSSFHRAIAKRPGLGKPYLGAVGALLRASPRFPLKSQLVNNLASTEWPQLMFEGREVEVCPGSTIRLIPHPGEFDFLALFCRHLNYEPGVFQTLASRLHQYDTIIEVGANVGVYTVFFANQTATRGRKIPIYAFEPSRTAYLRLLDNLKANNAAAVIPFNVAVADGNGFVEFFEPDGHLTNGSLSAEFARVFANDVRQTMVPSVGCTELTRLAQQSTALLLKIDVEGAESRVLQTLRPLIEQKCPDIVVEVLASHQRQLNALEFLRDAYDFFLMTERGLDPRRAFEADADHRDYLLVPKAASAHAILT